MKNRKNVNFTVFFYLFFVFSCAGRSDYIGIASMDQNANIILHFGYQDGKSHTTIIISKDDPEYEDTRYQLGCIVLFEQKEIRPWNDELIGMRCPPTNAFKK